MPELKPLWEIQLLDGRRRVLEIKLREGQMSGDLKEAKNEIDKRNQEKKYKG
jgi:predicted DNA-binding antitoxin AbrB/MazE fold protein